MACMPEVALSPLCGHVHRCSSTEFVTRKIEGHGDRLLPRSGQPLEMTLLRRRGLVIPRAQSGTPTYPACNFRDYHLG